MDPARVTGYIILWTGFQAVSCHNVEHQTGQMSEWALGTCILHINEPCDDIKVRFLLYAVDGEPLPLQTHDPNPPPGTFDADLPTKILIHGYAGHAEFNSTVVIRQAYLARRGSNVIAVDWGPLASPPCYFAAIFNMLQVATCTTHMLLGLATKFSLHLANVHAVGFSLGAHIAALLSNSLSVASGSRLGRITGLDPALPLFATLNDGWKLDSGDADFVDVIHTNGGVFGKIEAAGHADFFVNGGSFQPACAGHRNVPVCSHLLAAIYFAESVTSDAGFWGRPCTNFWQYLLGLCPGGSLPEEQQVLMGDTCSGTTRGIFLVETSDSPPYALGKHHDFPPQVFGKHYYQYYTLWKHQDSPPCAKKALTFPTIPKGSIPCFKLGKH
ncbi:phospholipase A1 member A [Cryptotermes secundus]|uniref:phospholipase A1 member A n=1 Tax=Cryptotermes secundus TaxID=105785 RepID=UPI000CD7C834|nr:phospholipase A1 member A [Cryptotermes secundus]